MKLFRKCLIFGKLNCEPPEDYDEDNDDQPYYDPEAKYGEEIPGALKNGYTYEELSEFYNKLKGYASYLFNKSHAACYAIVTLCTMYLMKNYTAKFIAALMSMQTEPEKINLYTKLAESYGIKINHPDINRSDFDFTEKNGEILYGFNLIKGVGEASIDKIIETRPFDNMNDMLEKVEKKFSNKRVMYALILSGAFDFENNNRYQLINDLIKIRKIKEKDINNYKPELYTTDKCIEHEMEILGASITNKLWWNSIKDESCFEQTFKLISARERNDKNGKVMCFPVLEFQGIKIDGLVFSSLYKKVKDSFDTETVDSIKIIGKRSGNKIIVNGIMKTIKKEIPIDIYDDDDDDI